jgi:uncharacterized protein (DUF1697 family)
VFQSDLTDRPVLIQQLEASIEQRFGFHSTVLLRTLGEFRDVVSRNPVPADGNTASGPPCRGRREPG